ncbi:uncharacterized protein LY89DRAFT_769573 [Mollisia scopiformis]|uniref:Uncharacterized protein n=1 Tax=Mollisia scopiformis TaxID=149040 RepID=A0A132B323_MOLSC|nr:uncharacterized protein LY89DRAFT_769573 [Mollisia scopiformis]KUJ06314.1 hypothetical protein LY89DRAFT_769573 [Mollisia scopiformis]
MLAIKSIILLFTSAVLATSIPRDAHALGYELLYSDLVALDKSVNTLTAAVNAYTNGTEEAAPILAGVSYVNATNRKGYYDAMSDRVAVQNLNDSITIADYVADPIAVDITAGVAAIIQKKDPLVESGLPQQILDGLNLLVMDHETLSAAIAAKLDPAALVVAAVPVAEIDVAIRSAIADFEL